MCFNVQAEGRAQRLNRLLGMRAAKLERFRAVSVSQPAQRHAACNLSVLQRTLGRQSASTRAQTTCTAGLSALAPTSCSPALTEHVQTVLGGCTHGHAHWVLKWPSAILPGTAQQHMRIVFWITKAAILQTLCHSPLCLLAVLSLPCMRQHASRMLTRYRLPWLRLACR